MDKYEYREKTGQMIKYVQDKSYDKAKEIADVIDWKRVKNVSMLCTVSEIYEHTGEYQKSREILFIAYDRGPENKKIVYRLGTLALRLGETEEALDCYNELISLDSQDPNQYILKYKILKAQGAPLQEQIYVLEELKKAEYIEKWAYELAKLYDKAGMSTECLEECDDLILWFSNGIFVQKALKLKMKYKSTNIKKEEKVVPAEENMEEDQIDDKEGVKAEEQKITMQEESGKFIDLRQIVNLLMDDKKKEKLIQTIDSSKALTGAFLLGMAVGQNSSIGEVEQTLKKGEGDVYETGQMKIEEILRQWEERQRKNAAVIEEKRREAEEKAAEEKAKKDEVPKDTETMLSEDIQKLLNQMEEEKQQQAAGGEITGTLEKYSESEEEYPEEESVEADSEEEEYPEEEYEEEEYPEEEYEEEEYPEEEYEEEEYPEEEYEEEEYPEEEYEEEEYPEEGYEEEEYSEEEYDEEEEPSETEKEEVLEIEEPDEEDSKQSGHSSFDTGFIVQGRYDLSATSEIGLKLGLTEEQKKLFSYFVPIRGMSEQLVDVLEQEKVCKKRYGTSRTGNILVIGHKGSGKTVLAVDIVKAIHKQRNKKQGKIAIITGNELNKKNLVNIIQKLNGGALIIEKASGMNARTIDELTGLMEEQTGELLFILEDERRPIEKMLSEYPDFRRKFTSRVELPIFINDELVTFGQTYAKESGYSIDEMGILALYSRIDVLQKEDHFVTVAEVKQIMDDAIAHSQKANVKSLMKRVFGKSTDETDRIILKEDDFKH